MFATSYCPKFFKMDIVYKVNYIQFKLLRSILGPQG